MMGSIGITVGIIGYFLFFSIELLSDLKYRTVRCTLPAAPCSPHGVGACRRGLALSAFRAPGMSSAVLLLWGCMAFVVQALRHAPDGKRNSCQPSIQGVP